MEALWGIVREALIVTSLLCFPVLAAATLVGTLVAVVQAATQVQEQTLTLLPKIAVVGAMIACGGGLGLHLCAELFTSAVRALPRIASGG